MRHHPDAKSLSNDALRKRYSTNSLVPSTQSAESTELRHSFSEFKSPIVIPITSTSKITLESLDERVTALERKFDTSQFVESIDKLGDLLNSAALEKELTEKGEPKTRHTQSSTSVLSTADSVVLKKKKRCRFFPNCREGSRCAFFHPNKRCAKFPHCIYGATCLFLHPYCPRGITCGRIDCPYTHYIPIETSESEESVLEAVKEENEEEEYIKPVKSRADNGKAAQIAERFTVYRKDLYPSNSGSSQDEDDFVSSSATAAVVRRHTEKKEKKALDWRKPSTGSKFLHWPKK